MNPSASKNITIFFVGTLLVLIIIVGFVGYRFYQNIEKNQTISSLPTETVITRPSETIDALYQKYLNSINIDESLSGDILVTTLKKTDQLETISLDIGSVPALDTFKYDLETKSFKTWLDSTVVDYPIYHPDQEKNLNSTIFVARPTKVDSNGMQILNPGIFLFKDQSVLEVSIPESVSETLSYRARLPKLSPQGDRFLYNVQAWDSSEEETSFTDTDSWDIVIGSLSGESYEKFADGYGGQWIEADEQLYVMFIDAGGLKIKQYIPNTDHETTQEFLLVSEAYQYGLRNQFSISSDGTYFVTSYPVHPSRGNSSVDIYELTLGESSEPSASLVHRIGLSQGDSGFWPLFSPDDRYVSMQVLSSKTSGNSMKIYDMVTKSFKEDIPFNDFVFDISFNTDWVIEN